METDKKPPLNLTAAKEILGSEKKPELNLSAAQEILKKKVETTPTQSNLPSASEGGTSGLTATPSASLSTPTETYTVKSGTSFDPFATPPKLVSEQAPISTKQPSMKAAATSAGATPTAEKTTNTQNGETSMLEDLSSSFLRGSSRLGSMLAKTPAFIYDIAAYPQNKIAELTGLDISASSEELANTLGLPENEIAKYYDNAVAESQKKLNEKYDKGITYYFKTGDYPKAFGLLANSVVESAPISISLALGNAAGLTTAQSILGGGVVFGSDKKTELDKESPYMTETSKMENALANGLLEGVFENFGVTKLGSMTKDIFMKEGVDQGRKIIQDGFKQAYLPVLKKYIGTTAEESISEAATQYAQNAVDKFSGAKPNIDLMDGVIDAAIIGLGSGVSMSAAPAALEISKTKEGFKRAVELQNEKQALENDLTSEAIPLESKQIISDKIKDLTSEEADLIKAEKEKYNTLSSEQQKTIDSLVEKKKKIIDGITNSPLSEDTKTILQKDLDAIDLEIESIFASPMKEQEDALNEEDFLKSIQEEIDAKKQKKVEIPESENKMQQEGLFELDDSQKSQPIELSAKSENVVIPEAKVEVKEEVKPTETVAEENPAVEEKTKTTEDVEAKINDIKKAMAANDQNFWNEKINNNEYWKNRDALEADLKKLEQGEVIPEKQVEEVKAEEIVPPATEQVAATEVVPEKATSSPEVKEIVEAPKAEMPTQTQEEVKQTTPVPKTKEQISAEQSISEEESQKEASNEDQATLKKMDDDVEVLKGYNKEKFTNKTPAELKKLIEDKYVGVLARAYKAKMEGKIAGPTYTAYRNELNKMMEEKLRPFTKKAATGTEGDNIRKGELKAQVTALGERVKEKLLGEGYKNIALSVGMPGPTPEMIGKLVDLTVKGVNYAIDAGFSVREATSIAFSKIKSNPTYQRLVNEGNINEKEFEKEVYRQFSTAKAEPQPVAEPEVKKEAKEKATEKEVEETQVEGIPVITQEDITSGKEGMRKQAKRRTQDESYEEINKLIPQEAAYYEKMDQQQIGETIKSYINELEATDMIMEAANIMLDEKAKKPMPAEVVHVFNLFLADRMKTLAKETDNSTLKQDLLNKAARLRENNDKNSTTIAKSLANLYIYTKEFQSSPEGVKAAAEQRQVNTIDTYLNKKQKTALESVAEPVNSLINSDMFKEEVAKATEQKLKEIAAQTKGKEWVNKVDAFDSLIEKTDDC